ncbi:ABC transporter permease [Solirubrobacter ginsenosidimutans]|uniref:ABC transporter permease n=1 Tax=Solirubrobacter ginsenosidimutans TaxID=490573 RepID=A0A9X3MPN8_9ACTN|nr:ABC transporter permease [Solirubrobacter ginsenosidimutans]MDA0159547.1 ABC transporter permease [Solirubrobacter ginsenosidimutans]
MWALRRVGVLIATVVVAVSLGHVLIASSGDDDTLSTAVTTTPRHLIDTFLHFDLGATPGRRCGKQDDLHPHFPGCASYSPGSIAQMLVERVPVDLMLLTIGVLLGLLIGVAGGRFCATHPGSHRSRALHVATALQLSMPVLFQGLLVIAFFSSNVSDFVRLPFLSGEGDYVPPLQDPIQFLKAMWIPWLLVAFPLSAFVLRITEASLREDLQEDFVRTARAKGVSERRVVNHHALPVAAPGIAAITGVNVSTTLINVALIEYVYGIPGMFRVTSNAVHAPADVAVLEGLVLVGVVLVVVANALADAVQHRLDPRVRV